MDRRGVGLGEKACPGQEGGLMPQNKLRFSKAVAACLTLLLAGCASLDTDTGFGEVSDAIAEKLDKRVHWRQGTPEDDEVAGAVAAMLRNTLSADEAVQIALLNNRQLQAAYEELGVAQANLVQAGLLRNPIFDAAATFPLDGGVVDLELALVQDFLDIFAIPLRKRVARSQFESAKLRATAAVMDLAARTRAAFYRLQAATQMLEMRQQVAQATTASLDAMTRLKAAGNVRELDVDSERLLHERAKLDLATAELAVIEAREDLNRLMGLWGTDTVWQIETRLPDLPAEPIAVDEVESQAVTNSIDLAILRQDIETLAARLGLKEATALLPELEAGAVAERDDREWEVGPAISFPIPIFDQGQARRAAARFELAGKQQAYYSRAVETRSAARSARQKLLVARHIAERYRDVLLPLEARVAAATQLQYNAMQVGVFQLLAAKERQITAGEGFIRALRDYWLARTEFGHVLNGRLPIDEFAISAAAGQPPGGGDGGH